MTEHVSHWRDDARPWSLSTWVALGVTLFSLMVLVAVSGLSWYASRPFLPAGAEPCTAPSPQPVMRFYDDLGECWRVWPGNRASLPQGVALYAEVVSVPPVVLGPLVLNVERRLHPMAVSLLVAGHCRGIVPWRGPGHEQWKQLNPCPAPPAGG